MPPAGAWQTEGFLIDLTFFIHPVGPKTLALFLSELAEEDLRNREILWQHNTLYFGPSAVRALHWENRNPTDIRGKRSLVVLSNG